MRISPTTGLVPQAAPIPPAPRSPLLPGEKVTFTREYTVPEYWFDHDLGLTFSWIESDGTPTVKINGEQVDPTVKWGYNLVLPIARELAGQKITIEVETTATKEGKTGLWNSIRTGLP